MARYEDEDEDDRPRRKKGKKSKSGMSTGTVLLIVGGVLFGILIVCGGIGLIFIPPARQQAREADRRSQDKNNLKQIGLAMHNYHDRYNMLPPGGIVRDDGTEMMSWAASLLPYMDQAPLYARINVDSGWKSPQNQAVFSQTVASLTNPGVTEPAGPGICHYAGNSHVFEINKCWRIRDFTDGLSNTIAFGDVSAGFKQWGDPTNVRDPGLGIGQTPDKFGSPYPGGTHFLLMDGSVRFVSETVNPRTLQALATPNGGEVVSDF